MADWTEEEDLLLTRAMKSCNGDLSSVRALLRTKRRRTAAEVKTRIKYLKLDGTSDFKVSLSTGSSSAKPKSSSTISSLHSNSLKANSTKSTKALKPNVRKRSFSKVDTIDDDSSESSASSRRVKLATRSRAVGVNAQTRRQNEDEDVENTNLVDESQTKLDVQIEERKNLAIAKSGHSSRVSIDTCTDRFTSYQPTACSDVIPSTHHSSLPSQWQGQTSNVSSLLPAVSAPRNSCYSSVMTAVPLNYDNNTTPFKQTSVNAGTTDGYGYRPAPDTDESPSGVPDPRTVTVSSEFGMKFAGSDPNPVTYGIDSIGKPKREPQQQDVQSVQQLESTDSGISMNSKSPLDPTSSDPSSFPSSSKSDSSSSSSSTTFSAPDSIDTNTSNTSFFRPSLSADVFLTKSRSIHLIHQRSLSATRGAGAQEWKQYELPPISPIWGSFCQSGSCAPGHAESCVGGEKPNEMCFSPSVETAGTIMKTGGDGRRTGFVHLTTEHPSENGNGTKRQGFIVLPPDTKLPSLNDVLLSSFPGGIHAAGLLNASQNQPQLESQRRIMDINRSTEQHMGHQNEIEKKLNVIRHIETDVESLSVQCVRVETQGETDTSIGMANPEISISKAKKNKNFKGLKLKLASPSTSSSKSPQLGPSLSSSSIDAKSDSTAIQTASNLSLSNPSDISILKENNEKPTFKVPLSKPKLQIQTKVTSSQHLSTFGNSSTMGKSMSAGFPTPLTLPLPSPSVPSFGLVSPVTALFPGLDSLTPQSTSSNIPSAGLPVYSCSRSSQSVSNDVESTIRGRFNLPDPGRESESRYKDRLDGRIDEMDEDEDEDE